MLNKYIKERIMKIQHNVNANPAFGTKLIIKGPRARALDFAKAIEGGHVAQKNIAEISTLANEPYYVATGKDARLFRKEKIENLKQTLHSFFEGANEIDLAKPMQYILQGPAHLIRKFAKVFKAFEIQEQPVKIVHDSPALGKSYVMVGEAAREFKTKSGTLSAQRGIIEPEIDIELVHTPDFKNSATVINVTE